MTTNPAITRAEIERIMELADAQLKAAHSAHDVWEEASDALNGALSMPLLKAILAAALRGIEPEGEPDDESDQTPIDRVVGAPARIWLCYGDIQSLGDVEHQHCDEVIWCSEPQETTDVEYIRADLVKDVQP